MEEQSDILRVRMLCPACNQLYPQTTLLCPSCGVGLLEVPDMPLLSGTVLDGRYDVENVVGSGGMGVVYKARQRGIERDVAIKVLHPQYTHDPKAVRRFFREAQASSRLVHPNVVSVYDFGRSQEGQLYMVMELLEGFTLGDFIHYRAPLEPSLALAVTSQVCEALEEAHRFKIVHRDLKPDNVLLSFQGDSVWAKVLDFGIARMVRPSAKDEGLERHLSTVEIAGTPAYMSPEQILGEDPDPRSDLYSLGVILFEMLTKERPFDDETSVALCMKQLNEVPPRVKDHVEVSDELDQLVDRLLSKQASERPQSAREVKALVSACKESHGRYQAISVGHLEGLSPRHAATRLGDGAVVASHESGEAALSLSKDRQRQDREGKRSEPEGGRKLSTLGKKAELFQSAFSKRQSSSRRLTARDPEKAKAIIAILFEKSETLEHAALRPFWDELEAKGLSSKREAQRLILYAHDFGIEEAVLWAKELQEKALHHNLALRIGLVATKEGQLLRDQELASRLAASATHGALAMEQGFALEKGFRHRPMTSLFLPDRTVVHVADVNAAKGKQAFLWGRNMVLRKMGMLADAALQQGAESLMLHGVRGMGKTAILSHFGKGRQGFTLSVSPLSKAFPGYVLASFVERIEQERASSGHGDGELSRKESLKFAALEGEKNWGQAATPMGWAKLIYELLLENYGGSAAYFAFDDCHYMDALSQEVLGELLKLSKKEPWFFIATTREVQEDGLFQDGAKDFLKPLGLRGMNQLAEELEIPARTRHTMFAAAQGNPQVLRLLVDYMALHEMEQVPVSTRQFGEELWMWLVSEAFRAAPPEEAGLTWRAVASGREEIVQPLFAQAATLYLERGLQGQLKAWLVNLLKGRKGLSQQLAGLLEREGDALALGLFAAKRYEQLGLFREAAEVLDQAMPRGQQVEAVYRLECSRLKAKAGQVDEALLRFELQAYQKGWRRFEDLLSLASTLMKRQETEAAMLLMRELEKEMAQVSSPKILAEWWLLHAFCMLRSQRFQELRHAMDMVQEYAKQLSRSDAEGARLLLGEVLHLGGLLSIKDEEQEVQRSNYQQAITVYIELSRVEEGIALLLELGQFELARGAYQEAKASAERALNLANTEAYLMEGLSARLLLSRIALASGDEDEATRSIRALGKEVKELDAAVGLQGELALALAEAMVRKGLYVDARRYLAGLQALGVSDLIQLRAHMIELESHLGEKQWRAAKHCWQKIEHLSKQVYRPILALEIEQLELRMERLMGAA